MPPVASAFGVPPEASTTIRRDAPPSLDAKHRVRPSGDQHGDDSASRVAVTCLSPVPLAGPTQMSGLPDRLSTKAMRVPSGEIAAPSFMPLKLETGDRAPEVSSCEKMHGRPGL